MALERPPLAATRTLAFLFTDVEGSTRLWERHPEAMREALSRHDRILAEAVAVAQGQVVKTTGDGVMAVFGTARDAVAACLAAQVALAQGAWGETGPLRVRMGLHVGEGSAEGPGDGSGDGQDSHGQDYHGQAVNRAARIMSAGHGGQILLSGPTAALVMDQLPTGTSLRDLGEHRLKDLARPERVYQLDYPSMPESFAPLATVDAPARSLPGEPSAFVGREGERAQVAARLTDPSIRLLTLTGPGGIGKTRLALRAARDVVATFASGAAFVDLSLARDTGAVLTSMARELGFSDVSEGAQLGELTSRIGTQRLLVILDNVEQVTIAGPTLAQLLAGCPELTLLVTSREPLRVRGEHLFVVPPLPVPSPGRDDPTAAQLEQFEAIQLFVALARTVKPEFRVTDDNAAVVADICRRLEGVPLAIELATARLRVFSLEALRERLGSRLRALGSGARDLPERQQTLRSTIDWSFQLLTTSEQRLFGVMACFHGAAIEAVEAVTETLRPWLSEIDAVDGLISLADKSLLRQIDPEGDEPRFEMLESVREFALERLEADAALASQARNAHAAYFAEWAAARGSEMSGVARPTALRQLVQEVENLRAAWRCAIGERDVTQLESLLGGLGPLYDAKGWYRALTDLASETLGVLETMPPSLHRDVLMVTLRGNQARALTAMEGYTAEVELAYERLLASLEGGEVPQVYPVVRSLATLYSLRAESTRAAEMGRQILRLAEHDSDPAVKVDGHLMLGTALTFAGRIEDGLPDLEAGIAWSISHPYEGAPTRLGPDPRVGTLTALSLLLWWQGGLDRSLLRSDQAVELAQRLGHPSTTGYARFHAALLRLWRGEPGEARERAVGVIEVADEYDLHIWKAAGTVVLGASAVALGIGDEGLRWIEEGLERYRGLRTPPIFWPFLLGIRAVACARAGRTSEGLVAVDEAIAVAPKIPDLRLTRGDLLLSTGERPEAERSYEQGWELAHGWGARTSELRAALRLCRLAEAEGSPAREARLTTLREVYATFTEGLETADLVEAREVLGG